MERPGTLLGTTGVNGLSHWFASNRECQMNARATATQAGYMRQLVAAVSLSPIHRG